MLSIPGVLIGACIVNKIGRRNLLILGFSGCALRLAAARSCVGLGLLTLPFPLRRRRYLAIGLTIGCAYDKVVKIVPLFIVVRLAVLHRFRPLASQPAR